jgi:asparagine N-glycosylation enzyme membrane subunit Stt3
MNEACDRCGPAVRAVYHASKGGQLYLCGHCADQLRSALSAQGWALRPVAVPLLAAGFIAGAGLRALTAAVIRTRVGAGLVILLGWPAVAVLLAWALARSIYLAPPPRRPAAGHGI